MGEGREVGVGVAVVTLCVAAALVGNIGSIAKAARIYPLGPFLDF